MATVTQPVRIVLVVLGLVLLAGLLSAPDAPRFSFGGETYAVKALGIRRVLVGLGVLGIAAWRLRRGAKAGAPALVADAAVAVDPSLVPRQSVDHRLDTHEAQIQELVVRLDALESPAPKPVRKRAAKKREAT